MSWFQKLSARAKLMLAFVAVSALLSGVAGFTLYKMNAINDSVTVLAGRDIVGLRSCFEANLLMGNMRKIVRDAILDSKPEVIQSVKEEIGRASCRERV